MGPVINFGMVDTSSGKGRGVGLQLVLRGGLVVRGELMMREGFS